MTRNPALETDVTDDDAGDASLRPQLLDAFIGQEKVRANLKVFIEAAKARCDGEPEVQVPEVQVLIHDGLKELAK